MNQLKELVRPFHQRWKELVVLQHASKGDKLATNSECYAVLLEHLRHEVNHSFVRIDGTKTAPQFRSRFVIPKGSRNATEKQV